MKQIRLDKYLTQTTGVSRSEAKILLKKGRVAVEGEIIKKPEKKIDPENARVTVDGTLCHYAQYTWLMLNKPQGVVSATEDARERTVLDLIKEPVRDLFPVGRLDKDTEGLLLLTNDGAAAHALLSPKKHVDKIYYALLDGPVGEKEQKEFADGLDIGEEQLTLPARLETIPGGPEGAVYITIQEGRFHQVKRMAQAVGRKVLFLKRIAMGNLRLDESLAPGEYRPLTEEEIRSLPTAKRSEEEKKKG